MSRDALKRVVIPLFILFIISIMREAQKHSTVQYKSGAKVKQEKAYASLKKEIIYLGRHNVDNRLNFRVVKIVDK